MASALLLVLVVGGTGVGRAAAQLPTTDRAEAYRECRAQALAAERDELEAARECVPDEAELRDCLGTGRVTASELASCVEAQVAGRGDDRGSGEPDDRTTTTAPTVATSTTAASPGIGPIAVPVDDLGLDGGGGDGDGGGGLAVPVAIALAASTLVVGFVAGRARRRPVDPFAGGATAPAAVPGPVPPASPRPLDPSPTTPTGPAAAAPVAAVDPEAARAGADRDQLVATLIDLAFEARSEAVRGLIVQQLAVVGVEPVVVSPGERFDPSRHRGIHAESAGEPDQAETIAAMERPGWIDRGRVLRPPEVVVRRWDGGDR